MKHFNDTLFAQLIEKGFAPKPTTEVYVPADVFTIPSINNIAKRPVQFSYGANAWICRDTQFTFCSKSYQSTMIKPDCDSCVIRRCW